MKVSLLVLITLLFSTQAIATEFEDILRAAEAGNSSAQSAAGVSYHFGVYPKTRELIEKNSDEAVRWLNAAIENGNCFAAWFLGGLYNEGKGVEKNLDLAAKYFLLAAERGHVKAQRNISSFYFHGTSVVQDYDAAFAWVSLANYNELGHKNTQALLNMIVPKLENREFSNYLAAEHIRKHSEPQADCGNGSAG